jgi:hypothetical protein
MADSGIGKYVLIAVGGYLAYKWYSGQQTTAAVPPAPGTSPGTPPPAGSPAPTPPPASPSADNLYMQVVADATADAKAGDTSNGLAIVNGQVQVTFSGWNYFTARRGGFTDLPDYATISGQQNPGPVMTGPQYWNLMAPWLKTNKGLTGILSGLGALVAMQQRRRR